jgi:Ni,Fe-hydrogenase III large subunit
MIKENVEKLKAQVSGVLDVIENEPALRARTQGVAPVSADLIRDYCVVGPVARASGVDVDLRRDDPWPPYDQLDVNVITRPEGDAWARTLIRALETRESLRLCEILMRQMPDGPVTVRAPVKCRRARW